MNNFAMYAKITAHPGQRDALVQILLEGAELSKSVEGCVLYIVNESVDDPNVVWVTELWESSEAHDASLRNEGTLALLQRGRPLIAGAEPIKLRPVGGKGIS